MALPWLRGGSRRAPGPQAQAGRAIERSVARTSRSSTSIVRDLPRLDRAWAGPDKTATRHTSPQLARPSPPRTPFGQPRRRAAGDSFDPTAENLDGWHGDCRSRQVGACRSPDGPRRISSCPAAACPYLKRPHSPLGRSAVQPAYIGPTLGRPRLTRRQALGQKARPRRPARRPSRRTRRQPVRPGRTAPRPSPARRGCRS